MHLENKLIYYQCYRTAPPVNLENVITKIVLYIREVLIIKYQQYAY